MKMRALLLPLLGLALLIVPVTASDWPGWRGPDRTDVSRETGLLKTWPKDGPALLWTSHNAGTGYAGLAVVGDRLYSMGARQDKESLYALDLKTQKLAWEKEIGQMLVNGWGDGPRGTPTVDGEFVYAISGKGNVVCAKAGDGEVVWKKSLVTDLGGGVPGWGYTESPLVDGEQVIVTPGGKKGTLAALDRKTGATLWQSKDFTDGAQYSSVVPAELGGVRQYVQMTGKTVVGVAVKDGKVLWRYARNGPTAAIPTPIVKDPYVYATSGYGAGCDLIKIISDGTKGFKAEEAYKNKTMINHHGGVVLVGDYLYGYSDKGGWTCQELTTGKAMWTNKGVGKGAVTCADGMLYCFGERQGEVALVEASPTAYKEVGRFTLPEKTKLPRKSGQIWTHPTIANGKLYLRDQDLIFCYNVAAK